MTYRERDVHSFEDGLNTEKLRVNLTKLRFLVLKLHFSILQQCDSSVGAHENSF